ncbi:N-acetyltransferase family protein [Halomonas sp. HP20-15]|uniref:GNAT family N-acetyltransferase n=1 Tax=Halomonas sp. HP20-15 TaxID=3085901 RepID=UPI0029816269|nr:GNAT family N-acetyltransferase [Halomonas sp. HP20-15]MDW5377516.1 N-acetyltransferase family protein [Halomonas sp. HP20-15]
MAYSATASLVRDARAVDIPAIRALYAEHVLHGTASFELTPPTLDEMRIRHAAVVANGLPYLLAERDGDILGFCYATPYRPRPAYRYSVENSVYVAAGKHGQGIGSALLTALIERCESGPWRQMLAVIGDSANSGSIALHRRHGFEDVGTFRSVGYKFDRWLDTVLMQRPLGDGDRNEPPSNSMAD